MIVPTKAKLGETVIFEGYADDYGCQIIAMEFSLDEGKTWARHDTSTSSPDLMVHWNFAYTPVKEGHYRLKARSINSTGRTSPLCAVAELYVDGDCE